MSKKLNRVLSLILAVVFGVAMVLGATGCGAKQDAKTADAPKAEAAASDNKSEVKKEEVKPVEIVFSEFDDPNVFKEDWWKEWLSGFEKANPNIRIKRIHNNDNDIRTNWQNQVAAGQGPDVTFAPHDSIGLFATAGTALELDNFFSQDFYSQLDKNALDAYKFKGKIYGIPYRLGNAVMLIYNKKLVPEAPKTMDELIAKAKELTNAPKQYGLVYDMVEPYFIMGYLGGYGGKVLDDDGKITLDTDAMKKMTQLVYDFKYTHKITPKEANSDVANNLFKEGKAAFTICGPWLFKQLDDAKIEYGLAPIPKLADGDMPRPYSGAKVMILNPGLAKNKAKAEAVKKFVEYCNGAEQQLKMAKMVSEIPTNLKALEDPYVKDDPKVKALSEQLKYAVPQPNVPEMRAIWDALKSKVALVMAGKLKPEEAPKVFQSEAEKLAKNLGKK
ncbi:MAG: maltose ABC transporter substrate-binding protein [Clostridia bacterium]|nr:maltose ABC transporter substrate-binding protein [Clostridia bacterium]